MLRDAPITQLRPLLAFSLHSGRYRAATWRQGKMAIVWLLATHIHREGSPEDAYNIFEQLHRAGRLLPTRADAERVIAAREPRFGDVTSHEIPRLLTKVYKTSGDIHEDVLGGRISVRVLFENGEVPPR